MGGVKMAMKRTKTIKFGEFMSGEYKVKEAAKKRKIEAVSKAVITGGLVVTTAKVAIPAMVVSIPIMMATSAIPAMAAASGGAAAVPVVGIPDAVREKIMHAFDPLVDLMVGLSVPIAGVMITGGALMILIGQKDTGFKWIMNAALGYVLVQLSPMLINLLIGVGSAV
jgi:hypothetical protein